MHVQHSKIHRQIIHHGTVDHFSLNYDEVACKTINIYFLITILIVNSVNLRLPTILSYDLDRCNA